MRWITRERAMVDRIACPWLIRNFVDKDAEFIFVPADKVLEKAKELNAIPFDVKGAELNHFFENGKEFVSFDAIIKKYELKDPALLELAKIVRGADADIEDPPKESYGLKAMAKGFRLISSNDFENMEKQFPAYDALYAYCKDKISSH